MEFCYVLDASAFINGFKISSDKNFTVSEISTEIKDFESKLNFDMALKSGKLTILDVSSEYILHVERIIRQSGDNLRLSDADKKLISLAYMLFQKGENVKVISDDYTIQNTLKIMNIPYSGILTFGIKDVYNWKKVCSGCKKEFEDNYPFDDCDVCGSEIFKQRIKVRE